ncbi:ATP-dependent RNA helicase [Coemansia sp. Benny D115]|nr:ATP-dependent RNA helicase [Coemansia sp. Benny D115]
MAKAAHAGEEANESDEGADRWDWKDVALPSYIAGADNEMGGMVSLQEIDGIDCTWEEDAETGGRTLKFVKKGGKGGKMAREQMVVVSTKDDAGEAEDGDDDDDDDYDDFEGAYEGVNWDDFVAVDDFSEEKAENGELTSIGEHMRRAAASADADDSQADDAEESDASADTDTDAYAKTEADEHMDVDTEDVQEDEDEGQEKNAEPDSAEDIADPDVDVSAWEAYGLHPLLLRALKHVGFSTPTEIQSRTLYESLNGRDIIGAAETGSGKTLAFGIPMLQRVADADEYGGLTGLVLTPTRELAMQVRDHLVALGRFARARVVAIVGGMAQMKQERLLNSRPNILVATPGRLWELVSTNDAYLRQLRSVRFLAIDEADRMLERGHFREVKFMCKALNEATLDKQPGRKAPRRQTFVFSATLLKDLQLDGKRKGLSGKAAKHMAGKPEPGTMEDLMDRVGFQDSHPHFVDVTTGDATARTLVETRIDCLTTQKDHYLYYFVTRYPGRTLVFVNSIDSIRRLLPLLRLLGIDALGLHAQMEQRQRLKSVERFRDMPNAVLVASDVAARGLDIPRVDHVVHYQAPRSGDLYVHRSGRTARASREGLAVMLISPEERKLFYRMCAKLDKDIKPFPVDLDLVGRLQPRVELARDIELREHRLNKAAHERNWFKKNAKELDIELDSDFMPSDDEGDRASDLRREEKQQKQQIKAARARLAQMLRQKVLGRGMATQYLSSSIVSDLADRLIGQADTNAVLPLLQNESALETAKAKRARR